MKKKVLFVVDERQMGGVSILLSDILNKINIKKYQIDVAILHNVGECLDKLPREVKIIYGTKFFNTIDLTLSQSLKTRNIKIIYSKLRMIFLMKTHLINKHLIKERKKMFKDKYDVEIAFKDGFCALFTACGNSTKKYAWLHTDYSMYDCTGNYRSLFLDAFKNFDKIIAISNSVLSRFLDKYTCPNTDVIFNIIDSDKIKNKSLEEKKLFNKNDLNLISVGRIHNMKGYDRLIDVMHELNLSNKLDKVTLRIIGDGPDFKLVKDKITAYGLQDKVILLGKKANPFPYVKASDCFLMCSRYEPFGLVVLESLILNVPVLSTDVASIREIVNDNQGIIVKNSEKGLYDGLLKIINNRKILTECKKNLKDYTYDITKIIKQIEGLLDEK